MSKRETKTKGTEVKLIKKVAPDKAKLPSRRDNGAKTELIKSVGGGCVPVGSM